MTIPGPAEWCQLEAMTLRPDRWDAKTMADAVDDTFVWGRFLEHAIAQKVLPIAAYEVLQPPLVVLLPARLEYHLQNEVSRNDHELRLLRQEAARVQGALRDEGITTAVTKGLALESTLYGDAGRRFVLDVDFLVQPQDRLAVVRLLARLGFSVGEYDWGTETLVDRPETEAHNFSFVRLTTDHIVPDIRMDFSTSVAWVGAPWDLPLAELLDPSALRADRPLTVLDDRWEFVATTLHAVRDLWRGPEPGRHGHIALARLADLTRMWISWGESLADLGPWLRLRGLALPVAWLWSHLDAMAGTDAVATLGISDLVDPGLWVEVGAPRLGQGDDALRSIVQGARA